MKITIELNGEPYVVEAGTRVVALLEELKLKPKRVAVEINQTVVPKAEYERTAIRAGRPRGSDQLRRRRLSAPHGSEPDGRRECI